MPSEWKQQCPGAATYRWDDAGAIEVEGSGFPHWDVAGPQARKIAEFWDTYQAPLTKYARDFGIPVAWAVGIIFIESGGNPWACSPCVKEIDGRQICSFAPGCGGGVASDGKTYSCCAYGLMQIIDQNARAYGLPHGAVLLGDPDTSIRIGIAIFRDALDGRAMADPIVAARMYNGCGGCKNGHAPCSGVGLFGVGGQNDYATKFAMAANTFIAMDLEPVSKQGTFAKVAKGAALFGVGALLVTAIYTQRHRW